jgi:hypothetical protein
MIGHLIGAQLDLFPVATVSWADFRSAHPDGLGRDVGATGAFVPVVDGQQLDFTQTSGGFEDDQTGSRWDVLGHATDGPLAGQPLEAVVLVDTFWFAWGAFQPESRIVD